MKEYLIIFIRIFYSILLLICLIILALGWLKICKITEDRDQERIKHYKIEGEVVRQAKKYHGVYLASKKADGIWIFINKDGVPCRLFYIKKRVGK